MTLGTWGEEAAAKYLIKKGYHIVEKNCRCKAGEIDIIALLGEVFVFIEVKTRKNLSYGLPCESITDTKLHHIRRVIHYYLLINAIPDYSDVRIDVVEVLVKRGKSYIHHIESVGI